MAAELEDLYEINELNMDFFWKNKRACDGMSPEIFFAGKGDDYKLARMVCAGCVIREDCKEFALATRQPGFWGGTSEQERAVMRAQRREVAGQVAGEVLVFEAATA